MAMTPRILLHLYPTFAVGGTQVRFTRIANRLGDEYSHVVVAMDGVTDCRKRFSRNLDVTFHDLPGRGKNLFFRLAAYRRFLAAIQPHLLVTSNWGTIEWAMANRDGKVRHLHMEDGFNPDEKASQFRRRIWMRRLFLRRATVLLPSRNLFAIAHDIWRLPERQLLYVPNGIDFERFQHPGDESLARDLGVRGDIPVIGTVATLRAEKNLGRLLDAFAIVRRRIPAQLLIVGDGNERPHLENYAKALGIDDNVSFTGACPNPEALLPFFTVFALSSDTEQMPLSLLEAMAAGRAVVSTGVGDVPGMLAPSNQPFVVAKNAESIAKALTALLDDPGRRHTIGEDNRLRAKDRFGEDAMITRYREIFNGTKS